MKGKNNHKAGSPHTEANRAAGPKAILTNACTQSRGVTVRGNQWAENKQLAPEFPQECCGERAKFHPGASLPQNSIIAHPYGHAGLTYKVETRSLELLHLPVSHFPVGSSEPSSNYLIWGIASFTSPQRVFAHLSLSSSSLSFSNPSL